jgi:hypothetical protein
VFFGLEHPVVPGFKFTLGVFATCLIAVAQGPVSPSDQDVPPSDVSGWNAGPFKVRGILDAYYGLAFYDSPGFVNPLRSLDASANQLDLNMAKLTLSRTAAPFGFQLDAGMGQLLEITGATEKNIPGTRYVEQAYFSLKPESWHNVQLDVGKFASSAGAEALDTADNWNYSRSFLFTWAVPSYHTGLRSTISLGNQFVGGLQWVGGWNNVTTGATYRTIGVTGSWTRPKVTWNNAYYAGPDENKSDRGMRNLYDTTLLLTPGARATFYINFDYGHDRSQAGRSFQWGGVAGAARFRLPKRFAISPRLEVLRDASGQVTGMPQTLKEITLTGTYSHWKGVLNYLEFRKDWSGAPCHDSATQGQIGSGQPTLLIGVVLLISPDR